MIVEIEGKANIQNSFDADLISEHINNILLQFQVGVQWEFSVVVIKRKHTVSQRENMIVGKIRNAACHPTTEATA